MKELQIRKNQHDLHQDFTETDFIPKAIIEL